MDCNYKKICPKCTDKTNMYCQYYDICKMRNRMDTVYNLSYIPEKYRGYIPLQQDEFEIQDSWDMLMAIWKNTNIFFKDYNNLFIYSQTTGNGKTSWACKIAQKFMWDDQCKCGAIDKSVLFFDFPKFFHGLKANISNTIKDKYVADIQARIKDTKLVIWDDVGVSANSQWEKDELLNLLNSRLDKYNIFTSNYTPNYLMENKDKIGERFVSRMLDGITVQLTGKDKRINDGVRQEFENNIMMKRTYNTK